MFGVRFIHVSFGTYTCPSFWRLLVSFSFRIFVDPLPLPLPLFNGSLFTVILSTSDLSLLPYCRNSKTFFYWLLDLKVNFSTNFSIPFYYLKVCLLLSFYRKWPFMGTFLYSIVSVLYVFTPFLTSRFPCHLYTHLDLFTTIMFRFSTLHRYMNINFIYCYCSFHTFNKFQLNVIKLNIIWLLHGFYEQY